MNRTIFALPTEARYRTAGGLDVTRRIAEFSGGAALDRLIERLDTRQGVMLSSGTQVPGRYESFDLGFADPPLRLVATGAQFTLAALNERGRVLIAFLARTLRARRRRHGKFHIRKRRQQMPGDGGFPAAAWRREYK